MAFKRNYSKKINKNYSIIKCFRTDSYEWLRKWYEIDMGSSSSWPIYCYALLMLYIFVFTDTGDDSVCGSSSSSTNYNVGVSKDFNLKDIYGDLPLCKCVYVSQNTTRCALFPLYLSCSLTVGWNLSCLLFV